MHEPLVTFRNVSVILGGRKVLDDVSLEIFSNEIASLIGLNGSGKTTLLRVILGIYEPTGGEVVRRAKRVGYVPQRFDFDRTIPISVFELLSIYSEKSEEEILKKLHEVRAEHLFEKKIGVLSGGELQRVLTANALLQDPELLLFDEATSSVDVSGEKNFYDLISKIHKEYRVTIVMVSHDVHTVFSKSSRIFFLNRKLCCHGAPKDVLSDPEFKKLFGSHFTPFAHRHD